MSYQVITLDLSTEIDENNRKEVVPRSNSIGEIVILSVPVGANFRLAIGDNPSFAIPNPVTFQPRGVDANNGLYLVVPSAQPGTTVEVIVASSDNVAANV